MALVLRTKVLTVTTAGTPVPVLAKGDGFQQNNVVAFTLQPQVNPIYVGDSSVLAASAIGQQVAVGVAQSFGAMDAQNSLDLARIFVDSATSATKVNVTLYIKVS